jgi:cellulose synthase (UDP-forming)
MLDDPEGPFPRWVSWHSVGSDQGQLGRLLATAAMPDAWIESVEWPARSNRSAVAIVVRDDAALPSLVSAFLGASQASESSQIAQSVSVLRGGRFSSFRTGQASYQVGRISVLDRLAYGFEAAPWLIALVAIFFCWIMAAVIEALLRRRARLRLGAEAD